MLFVLLVLAMMPFLVVKQSTVGQFREYSEHFLHAKIGGIAGLTLDLEFASDRRNHCIYNSYHFESRSFLFLADEKHRAQTNVINPDGLTTLRLPVGETFSPEEFRPSHYLVWYW